MLRKRKWRLLLGAVILALLFFALWRMDTESLLHSLRQVPLWLVFLLAGLQAVSQLLVNMLWHQVAKLAGTRLSFWQMLYINSQGAVIDAITPGVKMGGEITRAVQISRISGCSGEQAAAVVALQKIISMGALFVFPLAVLIAPRRIEKFMQTRKTPGCMGEQNPNTRFSDLDSTSPRFAFMRKARSKIQGFLLEAVRLAVEIRQKRAKCIALIGLAWFIWFLYPVKLFIIAAQFLPGISFFGLVAAAFAAYYVAMIPLFPGGLGGFEATLAGGLAGLGFALTDAAVVTVLFRFTTFWLVFAAGLVVIAVSARMRRTPAK